jgi:RNA polymerase subunit RPABC4/transcription elongation factor Spt4
MIGSSEKITPKKTICSVCGREIGRTEWYTQEIVHFPGKPSILVKRCQACEAIKYA